MIINHNMMAMNTHRQLGINSTNGQKSIEKLSSGMRINRAGDDAAGLAISEKMRAQVRGLNQASRNAQDGISLIQTAEGALQESQAILQRMRELAVQSSNDTNVSVDRSEIQKEVDQLSQELTRIADTTEFNTQKLLDGEFQGKFHIGANEGQNVSLSINEMGAKALGVEGKVYEATAMAAGTDKIEITSLTGEDLKIKFKAAETGDNAGISSTTAELNADGDEITITLAQAKFTTSGTPGSITGTEADVKAALESVAGEAGISVAVKEGETLGSTALASVPNETTVSKVVDEDASEGKGINVSSQPAASSAITTLQSAIEKVSGERSKLGAMQNRLEHTIKNLDTSAENLQASESRVRDVDMAKEMMTFTKNNILQQAAQSMLAQANQAPQGVLQLLR